MMDSYLLLDDGIEVTVYVYIYIFHKLRTFRRCNGTNWSAYCSRSSDLNLVSPESRHIITEDLM